MSNSTFQIDWKFDTEISSIGFENMLSSALDSTQGSQIAENAFGYRYCVTVKSEPESPCLARLENNAFESFELSDRPGCESVALMDVDLAYDVTGH
jgi:hypothetical protein